MPPRKISNRMAFGSHTVAPPPRHETAARSARAAQIAREDAGHGHEALEEKAFEPEGAATAQQAIDPIEPFAAEFAALVIRVPQSVRTQLVDRLERKQYAANSNEPDVRTMIEKAVASYEKKKKSGAAAAAARRARAKEARQAVPASGDVADEADEVEAGEADD